MNVKDQYLRAHLARKRYDEKMSDEARIKGFVDTKGWVDYFAMGNNCGGLAYQLSYGAVKRVFSDGIVSVGKSPSGVENERISIPNMNCVIYDSESGEIYIGTYKDILDYKSAGEDCTRIITHLKWQVPQAVYLFK